AALRAVYPERRDAELVVERDDVVDDERLRARQLALAADDDPGLVADDRVVRDHDVVARRIELDPVAVLRAGDDGVSDHVIAPFHVDVVILVVRARAAVVMDVTADDADRPRRRLRAEPLPGRSTDHPTP